MKIAQFGKGTLTKDAKGYLTAQITIAGHQYRKRVRSEAEAEQWILATQLDRDNRGELTAKQLNDASNALYFLRKNNVDISFCDLARYYLDNAFEGVVTVKDAVAEYLEKSKARIAEGTFRAYVRKMENFSKHFAEKKVASIKKKDVLDYLQQFVSMPPTWHNVHRCISKFFVECIKYGYCKENPCALLEGPRNLKAPKRSFLTPEDAVKVMRSAEASGSTDIVLYLALGLFGGLRPSEAMRLEPKHVNFKTGYVYISADITKTHSFKERTFQIEPALMAWLKKYWTDTAKKPVKIESESTLRYAVSEIFDSAGVKKESDVLRHSYGTYRFALTGNSAETAAVMGHAEAVGNKYYRGRATKDDAVKFFAIRPKDDSLTELDAL